MRYEDASLSGSSQASAGPDARDDTDALAHGARGPATGNAISGSGTISGSAGADIGEGARITAIEGAGGRDTSFSNGELRVAGEHGSLAIRADGSYRYTPEAGTPENVTDAFTYTLADSSGATDRARLLIEIGKSPAEVAANAERIVPGPDGVVVLPAGVDLSDIRVVGRDLLVMLPDGSQMVIVDGAVFVPQLVINNVEVPATNLAALLIDSEPQPAAGNPQSSGGNFGVPVAPLDPGVPLGDLLPPTELGYTPPEFRDPGFFLERDNDNPRPDNDVVVGENAAVQLDDDALAAGNPGGVGDDPDSANASGFLSGTGGDGQLTFDLLTTGAPSGFTYEDGPNGEILVKQDGTLVLTITVDPATGEYSVTQNAPIAHPAGSDENNVVFTISYTVTDEDGDSATGTLTVNVDDDTPVLVDVEAGAKLVIDETAAGSPAGFPISATTGGAVINAAALYGADGPAAANPLTYSMTVNGTGTTPLTTAIGDYPITLVQTGPNQITGQYNDGTGVQTAFTVTMNADGSVTVVQNVPLEHLVDGPPGPAHNDPLSLTGLINATVTATDSDGDSTSASIDLGSRITFRDDGPRATIDNDADGKLLLVTQDADTVGSATDTASIDFSTIIKAGGIPGADGGTVLPLSYSLGTVGGASGLTQGGIAINLFLINGVVVGSTATSAAAVDASNTVFDVSVTQSGVVTLTQYSQVDHLPQQGSLDPSPGTPPYSDQLASLVDNLVTLSATVTVVDNDGDTASRTLTLGIGANLQFADDGPAISAVVPGASVTIDETAARTPGFPISATSAGAVLDVSAVFGADGPAAGGGETFALAITGGGATGIVTAVGDYPITLVQVDATTIEGRYNNGAEQVAFTLKMNPDGSVTVTQNVPLEHLVDGPPGPAHNDALNLGGLVEAVVTITDADGDTATASGQIGSQIVFLDDGPRAIIDQDADSKLVLITQDADAAGAATDTASVDFSAIFKPGGLPGADGGTVLPLSYSLGTVGGASGLTQAGVAINLFLIGGVVVGSTATSAAAVDASNTVFDVSVSQSGVVTLNQYSQIDHASALDPTPGGAAYDDQLVSLVDNLVTLSATVTVVDNDGDTASRTATIGIGANLQFADDGPSINGVVLGAGVTLDETSAGTPAGFPISGTSATAVLDAVSAFGADGPAASGAHSFSINILGDGSTGIRTAIGDHPITLVQVDANTIEGHYSDGSDHLAFTVKMNADGTVTVTQNVPLEHVVDGSSSSALNDPLDLSGLIEASVKLTDFDGDSVTASADIGSQIVFRDDGPKAFIDQDADSKLLLTTQDQDTIGSATDSASVDFSTIIKAGGFPGADGGTVLPVSYALGTAGGASGLTQAGVSINLFLIGGVVVGSTATSAAAVDASNTVFDLSVTQGGVVTLNQFSQIDHPAGADPSPGGAPYSDQIASLVDNLVTLSATVSVVDNDGDTATRTATLGIGSNLQFADHGPTLTSPATVGSSVTLDESDGASPLSSGAPISVTSAAPVITAAVDYGADGQGAAPVYGLSLLNGSAIGTSVASGLTTAAGDFPITLTLTSATTITGTYNDGGVKTAFTITMNANGTVTVTQYTALEHLVDGATPAAHNDALNLVNASLQSLVNATVTYQDGDGDAVTSTAGIGASITFLDDAGTLGAFDSLTVGNSAGATGSGSFTYDPGADGHGAFAITGPALPGVSYTTVQNADGALLTATADPDGPGGNAPVTVFTLQVNTDGTYDFTLVTPEAESTQTVSLKGLTPGGPTPFVQTPDGLVEFTGSGNGVNSSTPGFGISNQFVGKGESFTIEFHSTGQAGNQASNVNPELVSSAVLTNDMINGALTIKVTFHNDVTGQTEVQTIDVTGSSTLLDPSTMGQFNWVEIEGVGGSGQGVRFTSLEYSKTIVPQDLDLAFQVKATDQDGDVTSTQTLNVTVDASASSSLSLARMSEPQSGSTVLFAAAAAAAGLAALPAAAETTTADQQQPHHIDEAVVTTSFVGKLADPGSHDETVRSAVDQGSADAARGDHESAAASLSHGHEERGVSPDNGRAGHEAGSEPSALLASTDAPAAPAPAPAAEIVMPPAEALAGLADKSASVEGDSHGSHGNGDAAVGKVIADALNGGGAGPDIDKLLAALPDGNTVNGGENPATHGLASQQPASVPSWDSGHFGGLSHGPAFTMEAAVLHHDAVQPA